ncbi:unnamed protein product [Urochloa decumbens]|uniref:F-box domain-containing protein n=1 Tax=Urochloa decumbens TaxID=240449 RepID=A0ABC9FPD5_9POAL
MAPPKSCAVPAAPGIGGILPLDALYEILLRLPAKPLCRLRAVCRVWRSLLSDPQFAAAHAVRHPGPLIIAGYAKNVRDDMIIVDIMDQSWEIVKQVRGGIGGRNEVISMDFDLVCVRNIDSGIYWFLNPATGAAYHLPSGFADEHMALSSSLSEAKYILGQVPSTGEYKVLRMFFHLLSYDHGCLLFEACTLNSCPSNNSGWRRKEGPGEAISCNRFTSLVIDGIVYLLCLDLHLSITFHSQVFEKDFIITFDLKTEVWGPRIPGPPISFPNNAARMFHNLGLPRIKQLSLAKLHGSLAIVHGPAPFMDIWILMDFDKRQWVKQYVIQFEQYSRFKYVHPLLVLGDGRIIIHKEDNGLLQIYDPRANNFTNSVELTHYSTVNMYTRNILSLDK